MTALTGSGNCARLLATARQVEAQPVSVYADGLKRSFYPERILRGQERQGLDRILFWIFSLWKPQGEGRPCCERDL